MFRDPVLSASLAMSALVSTVMMATLVVGPFYLSRALGLDAAIVGLVMSVGPIVAALTGVPAGRIVGPLRRAPHDHRRARRHGGRLAPPVHDAGDVRHRRLHRPIVVITAGYALFQAANNTAVMADVPGPARRHFRHAQPVAQSRPHHRRIRHGRGVRARIGERVDITTARPEAVATGMRITFAVAAILIVGALVTALISTIQARQRKPTAR